MKKLLYGILVAGIGVGATYGGGIQKDPPEIQQQTSVQALLQTMLTVTESELQHEQLRCQILQLEGQYIKQGEGAYYPSSTETLPAGNSPLVPLSAQDLGMNGPVDIQKQLQRQVSLTSPGFFFDNKYTRLYYACYVKEQDSNEGAFIASGTRILSSSWHPTRLAKGIAVATTVAGGVVAYKQGLLSKLGDALQSVGSLLFRHAMPA